MHEATRSSGNYLPFPDARLAGNLAFLWSLLIKSKGRTGLTVLFLPVTTLFPLSIPEFTQYHLDFPNMVNSGTLVRLSYQTHETEGQTWDFCGFTKVHTKSQDSSELPSLPCQRLSFHFLHRALKYPSLGFSQLFHNKLQL